MKCLQRIETLGAVIVLLAASVLAFPSRGTAGPGAMKQKIALVIGNSKYDDGDPVSGVQDAEAVADALRRAGFKVLPPVRDGRLADINKAIADFEGAIALPEVTVAAIFFSGHGFQLQNTSYLLPTDGTVSTTNSNAIAVDTLVQALGYAPNEATKLIFVNACRSSKVAPQGVQDGLAKFGPMPPRTVQFFAASPGQLAFGKPDGQLSPFSQFLSEAIAEAGLTFAELLNQVTASVAQAGQGQLPVDSGTSDIPADFGLRPPVVVRASVNKADDGLILLLRGDVVIDQSGVGKGQQELRLKPGHNRLNILVFNQKTYQDGLTWFQPEGWAYELALFGPGGTALRAAECPGPSPCFADHEDVPFKDGPHHGGVFLVATGDLYVDLKTAQLELRDVNKQVWQKKAPVWAQRQDLLFSEPIQQLPVAEALGLPDTIDVVNVAASLVAQAKLPVEIPDLSKISFGVRGNQLFHAAVVACMQKTDDRKADFKKSVDAALSGTDPTPFKSYDQSLTACVQQEMRKAGSNLKSDDIRVFTDLEAPPDAVVSMGKAAVSTR